MNRHIRAPRCLSVYFVPTFFYLGSTCLILIKPILECEKQPPYFQEVSVSPRLKGCGTGLSGAEKLDSEDLTEASNEGIV